MNSCQLLYEEDAVGNGRLLSELDKTYASFLILAHSFHYVRM